MNGRTRFFRFSRRTGERENGRTEERGSSGSPEERGNGGTEEGGSSGSAGRGEQKRLTCQMLQIYIT